MSDQILKISLVGEDVGLEKAMQSGIQQLNNFSKAADNVKRGLLDVSVSVKTFSASFGNILTVDSFNKFNLGIQEAKKNLSSFKAVQIPVEVGKITVPKVALAPIKVPVETGKITVPSSNITPIKVPVEVGRIIAPTVPGIVIKVDTALAQSRILKLGETIESLRAEALARKDFLLTERDVTKISQYNREIEHLEAEMAKLQNIGKRGFDTFGNKIDAFGNKISKLPKRTGDATQALINLSRVAQDAPFGFIGIANNLNPLLESFQRLRAESGSTGKTLKALGSSLVGAGGIGLALSVVSSLALVFGDKLFGAGEAAKTSADKIKEAKQALDDYVASLDDLSKIKISGAQNAQEELGRLQTLYTASQNLSLAYGERKRAVDLLQERYPAYFANLSDEAILAGNAKGAYDKLTSSILQASKARAAQKELDALAEETRVIQFQRVEAEKLATTLRNSAIEREERQKKSLAIAQRSGQNTQAIEVGLANVFNKYVAHRDLTLAPIIDKENKLLERQKAIGEEIQGIIKEGGIQTLLTSAELKLPDIKAPKLEKLKFNFFDKFFDVKPAKERAEQQLQEMYDTALDFAVKNQTVLEGLTPIINAPDKEKTVEAGRKFWADYQAGLFKFRKISIKPVVTVEPPDIIDNPILAQQFIDSLKPKPVDLGDIDFIDKDKILDSFRTEFGKINQELPKIIETVDPSTGLKKFVEITYVVNTNDLTKGLSDELKKQKKAIEDFRTGIQDAVNTSLSDIQITGLSGLGETIGQALTGGNIGDSLKALGSQIGSAVQALGAQFIKLGVIALAAQNAFKALLTNPFAAIAAGIGMVALGAAFKNLTVPKLAEGGIIPAGFANDSFPAFLSSGERVVPPGDWDRVINSGGQPIFVTQRLRGRDAILQMHRENKSQGRGG